MRCVTGLVAGRVQGVGFRYFVSRLALAAGLGGYVRNLRDGRVEFLLQGDSDAIDALLQKIRIGPAYSRVSELSFDESLPQASTGPFEIR